MLLGLPGNGVSDIMGKICCIAQNEGMITTRFRAPGDHGLARRIIPVIGDVARRLRTADPAGQYRALRGLAGAARALGVEATDLWDEAGSEPGFADSGDIEMDLPELFEEIGKSAKAAGTGWLLLMDDVQCLSGKDMSALIASVHRVSQRRVPVVFVGAGLPQVAGLAGEARSYAERLFQYLPVDPPFGK